MSSCPILKRNRKGLLGNDKRGRLCAVLGYKKWRTRDCFAFVCAQEGTISATVLLFFSHHNNEAQSEMSESGNEMGVS